MPPKCKVAKKIAQTTSVARSKPGAKAKARGRPKGSKKAASTSCGVNRERVCDEEMDVSGDDSECGEGSDEEEDERSECSSIEVDPVEESYVKDIYTHALDQFKHTVNTKGEARWRACVSSLPRRRRAMGGEWEAGPRDGHTYQTGAVEDKPVGDDDEVARVRNWVSGEQTCALYSMSALPKMPCMQYWTHAEINIHTEDERTLSHIPFIGETDEDMNFGVVLQKQFEEGIHGTRENWGEMMNDRILYDMMSRIRQKYPDPIDRERLNTVIWKLFPNKLCVKLLGQVFDDLEERFTGVRTVPPPASLSSQMHSFESVSCPRDGRYNCLLHGLTPTLQSRIPATRRRKAPATEDACGDTCYMHKYGKKDGHLSVSVSVSSDEWRGSEWSKGEDDMLRELIQLFARDHWCELSEILGKYCEENGRQGKSCEEVCSRAIHLGCNEPVPALPSPVKLPQNEKHKRFRNFLWKSSNKNKEKKAQVDNKHQLVPCSHEGRCQDTPDCPCRKNNTLCNKFCGCGDKCDRNFPGCRCAPGHCRTNQCQCFYASWECDPERCKNCNCDELSLDPSVPMCKNVPILRHQQKKMRVAASQIAGFGCYIDEDVDKGELISEYCGEIISVNECERRGCIYDKLHCSYIFNLNAEQVVDASRVGNMIRFANHSLYPNCRARVFVVNGDHRIGIFANQKLTKGEELFFDYSYTGKQVSQFVNKEMKQDGVVRRRRKDDSDSSDDEALERKRKTVRKMKKETK